MKDIIHIDVAGFSKEDLTIELTKKKFKHPFYYDADRVFDVVKISGEKTINDKKYVVSELVRLGDSDDKDSITAKVENGLLVLEISKKDSVIKKIEVK